MITSAIIPRPLARLPWRLIFLIASIAGFGLVVLYSAAGGSVQPWAMKQNAKTPCYTTDWGDLPVAR